MMHGTDPVGVVQVLPLMVRHRDQRQLAEDAVERGEIGQIPAALKPQLYLAFSSSLPTTTEPSSPAFCTICRAGTWMARRTMSTPVR
jgi:hypothetical protein